MDDKLYKKRVWYLAGGGVLGLGLAFLVFLIFYYFGYIDSKLSSRLISSLVILALSLPTFCILWYFRTEDIRTQIDKSQKQIEKTQENINQSSYIKALDFILEGYVRYEEPKNGESPQDIPNEKIKKIATGIMQLSYLRDQDFLKDKINRDLQHLLQGANLKGINLQGANLQGANLQEVNLRGTNLIGANLEKVNLTGVNLEATHLRGANLQGADLTLTNLKGVSLDSVNLEGAYLMETNLEGATLIGANLKAAIVTEITIGTKINTLEKAKLKGAKYNSETEFYNNFNPEDDRYGMVDVSKPKKTS